MAFLTDHEIVMVQTSFTRLIDNIDVSTRIFFEQLFTLDPSLKPLFKGDQQHQGRKMIQTLLFVVNALNNPTTVVDTIEKLSKRHLSYGVKQEYYATVGQALIATVHQSLGADATPYIEAAWLAAYEWVAGIAKAAAYPKETPETAS